MTLKTLTECFTSPRNPWGERPIAVDPERVSSVASETLTCEAGDGFGSRRATTIRTKDGLVFQVKGTVLEVTEQLTMPNGN